MAQERVLTELARQLLVNPSSAGLSPEQQAKHGRKLITMGSKMEEFESSAQAFAKKPFTVDYILQQWALARVSLSEAIDRGDDITDFVKEDLIYTRAYVIRR